MDAEEFERRMAAADVCFEKGRKALAEAGQWFADGARHIQDVTAEIERELDLFDPEQVQRELQGMPKTI